MNSKVYQRRRRLRFLLATSNSLPSIIELIRQEFNCSEDTVRRDIKHMSKWAKDFIEVEAHPSVLTGQLNLLFRNAMDSMLSSKQENTKHQARADALGIIKETRNLAESYGFNIEKPAEVHQTSDVILQMEANPQIMDAYRKSAEKQRKEKEARERAEKEIQND